MFHVLNFKCSSVQWINLWFGIPTHVAWQGRNKNNLAAEDKLAWPRTTGKNGSSQEALGLRRSHGISGIQWSKLKKHFGQLTSVCVISYCQSQSLRPICLHCCILFGQILTIFPEKWDNVRQEMNVYSLSSNTHTFNYPQSLIWVTSIINVGFGVPSICCVLAAFYFSSNVDGWGY